MCYTVESTMSPCPEGALKAVPAAKSVKPVKPWELPRHPGLCYVWSSSLRLALGLLIKPALKPVPWHTNLLTYTHCWKAMPIDQVVRCITAHSHHVNDVAYGEQDG